MDILMEFDKRYKKEDMKNIATEMSTEPEPVQRPLDYVLYKSHLLDGEKVLVVRDAKLLAKYQQEFADVVIYTPDEIEVLYRLKGDVDAIKKIHFTKKQFEGSLIISKEY